MVLWISIGASFLVSLISLVGLVTFGRKIPNKWLTLVVAFAAGTLLGGAFLELLPESVHYFEGDSTDHDAGHSFTPGVFMLLGILLFYIIEKFIHWHHHHDVNCHKHSVTSLSLIGDALHNFIDGILIVAAFMADTSVGIATTLAIIFHEIPQEIGDFAILVQNGFSKARAIFFNFISALASVLGAVLGYFIISAFHIIPAVLALTAGGFVYIALADIIPELHKAKHGVNRNMVSLFLVLGIILLYVIVQLTH